MPIYSIDFANHLASIAARSVQTDADVSEAGRSILYISLLSIEISLKALLEKAGVPVTEIRKVSHDLAKLLLLTDRLEVEEDIGGLKPEFVSGVRLRAVSVNPSIANGSVGALIDAASTEASEYPAEIRYGDALRHFPPQLIADLSTAVASWTKYHLKNVRKAP